jgi:hypothetical protein
MYHHRPAFRCPNYTRTIVHTKGAQVIPTIGRIVHYTNLGSVNDDGEMIYPPTQQAALITWVDADASVDLLVFYRGGGQFPMSAVPFADEYKRGHWSWPPRI